MKKYQLFWSIMVGFALLICVGCAPAGKGLKVEYVEGVVTLNGEPLPSASVQFIPVDYNAGIDVAGGYTNEKGVYKLTSSNGNPEKGAQAGEYVVTVSKIESVDLNAGKEYGTPTDTYSVGYSQTQLLPSVYQDKTDSPFRFTVKKGKNKFDLAVKTE